MEGRGVRAIGKDNVPVYYCPYFPIGSIYMNIANINPSVYFGGTWEQIKGQFLLGCDDVHPAESAGGNQDVILQNKNLPNRTMIRTQVSNKLGCGCNSNQNGWANICLDDAGLASNQPFSIMPPYFAVYIWKRIA